MFSCTKSVWQGLHVCRYIQNSRLQLQLQLQLQVDASYVQNLPSYSAVHPPTRHWVNSMHVISHEVPVDPLCRGILKLTDHPMPSVVGGGYEVKVSTPLPIST